MTPSKKVRYLVMSLGLLVTVVLAGGRDSTATESDAAACIDQMVTNAAGEGYRLRNIDTGKLDPGGTYGYKAVFTQGREYLLFGCGDASAKDLDIYLYDDGGNLVYQDQMSDAQPIVTVTPEWTGSYLVVVKLYSAEAPASYSFAVMYK